jgi:hypothetical protein
MSEKIAGQREANNQYKAEGKEKIGVLIFFQIHFYDFINENTAIGNHQEKEPFFNREAPNVFPKGIFRVEAPDVCLRKIDVPDQKKCPGYQNGRKDILYLLGILFLFVKALP